VGCLTVILTTFYYFARSVVAPGQTSSRPCQLNRIFARLKRFFTVAFIGP
jgi:hypothetical protein